MKAITTLKLRQLKRSGQKIVMITAYDYPSAKLVDAAGVDLVLVGDSLGVVVLGYEDTLGVTMEDMLHHTKAVSRGVTQAMVVADMPFMSYQVSPEQALVNAGRFLKEAGAQAVKLEGGLEVVPVVTRLTQAGIPVIGHLGFTPQAVNQLGGAIYQGKTAVKAAKLMADAEGLAAAGVCALVLELVPWELAELVSQSLAVPTIGIGSGPACDGQVLVYHDLLGLNPEFNPKHNKVYLESAGLISAAVRDYATEVRSGEFPTVNNTKRMDAAELQELLKTLK